jgi:glutathione S-transferase
MLTLFHSPHTRSSRVLWLAEELGPEAGIEIRTVSIPRMDGSGGRDPANPHPEGKVPLLVHDGVEIWETSAILTYLTDLFPEAGLGIPQGHPLRGPFLSWMSWYGSVMEPVLILAAAGIEHPYFTAAVRGVPELNARLATALKDKPFLLGNNFTVADLICQSPYAWFREALPEDPAIRAWFDRCQARPANQRANARDAELMAGA